MAEFRLSAAADDDVEAILRFSLENWGAEASQRYSDMLKAAMKQVAADPEGRATRAREDLDPGVRSFHTRFTRQPVRKTAVKSLVHVLIYRNLKPDLVEIVRVFHERMDFRRHFERGTDRIA